MSRPDDTKRLNFLEQNDMMAGYQTFSNPKQFVVYPNAIHTGVRPYFGKTLREAIDNAMEDLL